MRPQVARASALRAAIDGLPLRTRRAMLKGIERNPIIVGADGDPRGGVCPVYAISSPPSKQTGRPFARAWDRYARARMSRPASERELRTLRSMLETSIELEAEPAVFLDAAIAAHKASEARSRAVSPASETRPSARGERDLAPGRDSGERDLVPGRDSGDRDLAPGRDSGDRDRTEELSRRHGWAWLRPVQRYDDYERMLQALDEMAREAGSEPEPAEPETPVPSSSARG